MWSRSLRQFTIVVYELSEFVKLTLAKKVHISKNYLTDVAFIHISKLVLLK